MSTTERTEMSAEKLYELRPDEADILLNEGTRSMGASLDEIVSGNVKFFHLERMDKNCYWIGLDINNGDHIRIIIQAKRANIHTFAEVESRRLPMSNPKNRSR